PPAITVSCPPQVLSLSSAFSLNLRIRNVVVFLLCLSEILLDPTALTRSLQSSRFGLVITPCSGDSLATPIPPKVHFLDILIPLLYPPRRDSPCFLSYLLRAFLQLSASLQVHPMICTLDDDHPTFSFHFSSHLRQQLNIAHNIPIPRDE